MKSTALRATLRGRSRMLVVADGRRLPGILREFLLIGGSRPVDVATYAGQLSGMDMFDELVRFLTGVDDGHQSGERNDAAFALALLLIEVARSDDRVEAREQSIIEQALARRFGLDRRQVTRLMKAAEEGPIKSDRSPSFYPRCCQELQRGRTYRRHRDAVGCGLLGRRPDR